MPTTPVSVSTGIQSAINTTIYTVPAGKTAIVRAVSGQNSTSASVALTVSKFVGGQNFPVVTNQQSTQVNPTGAADRYNVNALNQPLTMAAGEQLKVYTASDSKYALPNVSTAGTTAADGSTYAISANLFANGIYMATGSCAAGAYVATSTDAITWTQRTSALPFSATFTRLACNGSVWVAVNTGVGNGTVFYSSDNGVTWNASVVVAAADTIWQVVANNSTFLVFTSANRIYSSTNGSTWTESSGYNTITGSAFPNIQNIGWTGTHWIVDNQYGSVASTDLTTWYGYVTPNVGRNSTTYYATAYSSAYNRYYTSQNFGGRPNIFSSPNGLLWTVLSSDSITPYKICCAGSNTVLIGVTPTGNSTRYKSTDGATWTTTSDAGGYTGAVHGLGNGYYLTMQNNGTNDACALSTDPTTTTGTTGFGGLASFILQGAAADPISGKWIGVGKNATGIYSIGGVNGTTVSGPAYNPSLALTTWGIPASVCWSPADSYFYMVTDTGYVFRMTAWNAGWAQVGSIGVSGSATSIKAVGTTLYVVSEGAFNLVYTSSTLTGGSGWTGYSYTSFNSYSYRNVANIARSGIYYGETLATNGTDLVWTNNLGISFALTPSNGTYAMRMPVGRGIGTAQTVNGNTFLYGGYDGSSYGSVQGYWTSTNAITTYGTFVSTSSNGSYWANPSEAPNKINYVGGVYYVTTSGINGYIWNGTTPTNIANNYNSIGSTFAGVTAVNPSNGWMIDGTNLASTQNGQGLNKVCKTTTPNSFLYAATITASIVEIS